MKKVKVFLVSLFALILGAFCFASCGGDEGVEGKYIFSYISTTVGGEPVIVNAGEEYNGVLFAEDFMTIEIDGNGEFSIEMKMPGEEALSQKGTWEEGEGNVVVLTVEGSSQEVTIEDGVLIFDIPTLGIVTLEK
ncbi:MAG: hypothetical protein IJ506_03905 [Clostridia bacterium]|nr:hypothetical protein [Clostridia bacterium]